MNTNEELIARARELTVHRCFDAPEQECGQHGDEYSRLMSDLADALESATTEWEYAVRNLSTGQIFEPSNSKWWRTTDNEESVRRRAAGPWLPVGSESDAER